MTAAVVLGVLGLLALIGAVLYLTQTASDLPSFMPGHVAGASYKRTTRGTAGVVAAIVLLVGAGAAAFRASRGPSSRSVSS